MAVDLVKRARHEHFTVSYAFGRRQVIWSTAAECVKCGTGREAR